MIVIYTDDHRFTGVHALGGQAVFTPHMDQLAYDGISFTQTYLQGAFQGATCIPSRAMLLTGRSLFDLNDVGYTIPADHTMMGEAFQAAGYHSYIVGKWHQDNQSLARGFDAGAQVMGRGFYLTDQYRMPLWKWNKAGKYPFDEGYMWVYNEAGKPVKRALNRQAKKGPIGTEANGPHSSEIFADDAVSFLENYARQDPFFMYVAFTAPHDPRQAPAAFKTRYPAHEISLPPSYVPMHPFDKADLQNRDESLAVWPRTPEVAKKELSDYYAIISHLDAQIGRIIETLKAVGLYENSIILLAGDSGLAVGNHGLMGKQNVYDEDGLHVPFIISGGYIADKGRRIDALSYTHDMFPTLCDLAGIEPPPSITGKSLMPVIHGSNPQIRDYTYHAYKQYERAYRKGDYKLIEFVRAEDENKKQGKFEAGSRVTLLFNVTKDPWETTNLAWLNEYQTLVKEMRLEMKEKALELHDNAEHLGFTYDFWDYF